ncbi:hypothetical protein MTR67_044562 [Solanum verrucosum]|uniref:Uncharacterized protein n=1 Tax=Solanum verrucosum TaxID=315347 RepID=A0AAF0URS8_SOLVR|nr:hypothetical protein MTR67_044562 [Solanum verrucosum]
MIELFTLLESFQGIQTGEDYLWWHGHNKGRYRVKEGYKQTSHRENQDFKWLEANLESQSATKSGMLHLAASQ